MTSAEDKRTIDMLCDRSNKFNKALRAIITTGDMKAQPATRLVQILNIADAALEYDRENFLQPAKQQVAQALTQDG